MNLILDIDGTLWDTTEIVAEAWNDAVYDVGLDQLGRFITADMLKKEFGKPMDEIIDDLFPGQPKSKQIEILDAVKVRESDAVNTCSDSLAYPGVIDAIKALSNTYKLYIVSNCQDGYIPMVMNKLGIKAYISDYECFGATGLVKAANIELIIRRNNLSKADTYYVGDTYGDYKSSCEAGIDFIHASYGFGAMPDDYTGHFVSSFEELLSFNPVRD